MIIANPKGFARKRGGNGAAEAMSMVDPHEEPSYQVPYNVLDVATVRVFLLALVAANLDDVLAASRRGRITIDAVCQLRSLPP